MVKVLKDIKWAVENIFYKFLGLFSKSLKLNIYRIIKLRRIKSINNRITKINPKMKLEKDFISNFKISSDTIFILGSGDSVNSYDNNKWEIIKSNYSIGFNYWIINDFIPNLYFIEIPAEVKHWEILCDVLKKKSFLYKNVPILFKDLINKRFLRWNAMEKIEKLDNNFFLCEDIPFNVSKIEEYKKVINILNKKDLIFKRDFPIFHKTGSVYFLINFAVRLGFKKIVLCGVDLNHNNYFFHSKRDYYESKGFLLPPVFDDGKIHATLNPIWSGELTIDKILRVFNERILKPSGVMLYVALKSSALYPDLPSYFNE